MSSLGFPAQFSGIEEATRIAWIIEKQALIGELLCGCSNALNIMENERAIGSEIIPKL